MSKTMFGTLKEKCMNDQKIINEISEELTKIENYTPQQKSNFFKKYGINIESTEIEKIDNDCGYIVANLSTNKIEIPEECDVMIENICSDYKNDNKKYDECKKKMRPRLLNISQTNKITISNNCHFNNYIDKIKNNKSEQANNLIIALQQKMNNKNNTIQCDKLNVNLTENEYHDIQNKCITGSIVNNSNYLKTCYGNKILQENVHDTYNDCVIGNGLYQNESTNVTPDSQNNKGSKINFFEKYKLYMLMGVIVCVCIILIIIVFYYVYNQKI